MAATPESKVKKQVVAILKQYGVYFFYPVTGGYGRSGVPDIVGCWKGRFLGIECKTRGNAPTQLQMKNLMEIVDQGGVSLLVDESGVGMLAVLMDTWDSSGLPQSGYISELLDYNHKWEASKKQTK